MKKNLVFVPIKSNFKKNRINIILGKWHYEGFVKNNYKLHPSKNNSLPEIPLRKNFSYIKKKYKEKVKIFKSFLNETHNINESSKYWEIIIGPFIYRSLIILYDRWSSLKYSLENDNISEVNISDYDFKELITSDYYEFEINKSNKNLNDFIYSEALKILIKNTNKTKLRVKSIKRRKILIDRVNYKKSNFFSKFLNDIYCKAIQNQKYFFVKTYFTFKINFLLNIKLLNLPCKINVFEQSIFDNKEFFQLRSELAKFKQTDNFDKFYNSIILKILPLSYLENFSQIKDIIDKITIKPKIIFSANSHKSNDNFKIWIAEKSKSKSKLIMSDHGLILEKHGDSFNNKIYDKYIKWNYTNEKNTFQLPPNLFLKKKKYKRSLSNKILILLTTRELYQCNFFDRSGNDLNDYIKLKEFVNSFEDHIKDRFYFRVHTSSPMQEKIAEKIKIDFENRIDVGKFDNIFNNYRLIIDTNPQTTFAQCLNSNIPVLIYYKQKFLQLEKKTSSLISKFKKDKIFFDNLKDLKKHLLIIDKNEYVWWDTDLIKKARQDFKKYCIFDKKNNLKYWENFFKKL